MTLAKVAAILIRFLLTNSTPYHQEAPPRPTVPSHVVLHASEAEGVSIVRPADDRGHWHKAAPADRRLGPTPGRNLSR